MFYDLGLGGNKMRPPLFLSANVRLPSIPDTTEQKTPSKFDIVPSLSEHTFHNSSIVKFF